MPRVRRLVPLLLSLAAVGLLGSRCPDLFLRPDEAGTVRIPGLEHEVRVVVDRFGSPHVFARTDTDMARVQGYVHARDRLWQMDLTRREVSGDLAEVLGPQELSGDVQNRTFGLRRAAERSLAALGDRELAVLEAYAEGVNAWIEQAEAAGELPPEYAELELTTVRRWTPVDTLAIGKAIAASLSLDIDGMPEGLEAYQAVLGDEDGRAFYYGEANRFAPMDPASTVADATGDVPYLEAPIAAEGVADGEDISRMARRFREQARESRLLRFAMERPERTIGSNEWGVASWRSATGSPMIANDPHLSLGMPSTFYENHLVVSADPVEGPMNVSGMTFPGVPFVILGQNRDITWGATTNPMDVADIFVDRLVAGDPGCTLEQDGEELAHPLCIRSEGALHPVLGRIAAYRANTPGDGVLDNVPQVNAGNPAVFSVPFRNHGPVVFVEDPAVLFQPQGETTVFTLQYTGFSATGEVETFRLWNRARNLEEFREGLRSFDFGSQNWAYADRDGNLAYFSSGEMPLRRDLERGAVVGVPPFFIRDGSGPSNWVPDPDRSQGQAIPYAVLPEEEMPHAVNPSNGFFVNANNDPAGTTLDNDPLNQRRPGKPEAIYYLSGSYDEGMRAGRITRLVEGAVSRGRVTLAELAEQQANTQQLDAELLSPFLIGAFDRAGRTGAPPELAALRDDPQIAEAVDRLRSWDFSTPTGIPEGWDASDRLGMRLPVVPADERRAAVAATIYNLWRAKAIREIVYARLDGLGLPRTGSTDGMKALHHVLTREPYTGFGESGVVDWIPEPATLGPEDRRDLALLAALRTALDALASDEFAPAFGRSTDQRDYLWGRLHRKVFRHELGGRFSVPPAGGFEDLAPDLPGLARDGGFEVVNASGFGATSDRLNSFMFGGGPVRRYVGAALPTPSWSRAVYGYNVMPGGSSGDVRDPLYVKQLRRWLTADYHPVEMTERRASFQALGRERFRSP